MGRNTFYQLGGKGTNRPWEIHPLWRGIGCLMIFLIPLLAYAGAVLLVDANLEKRWISIPPEFYWPPSNPILASQLGVALLLSMFGYFIFVIVYLFVYKIIGPPKYGPTDAPPVKRVTKGKKFSR